MNIFIIPILGAISIFAASYNKEHRTIASTAFAISMVIITTTTALSTLAHFIK